MIKKILILSVLATSLLQVGCASFKYQSAHSTAPELPESYNKKFRVDNLRYIYDPRAKQISLWAKEAEKEVTKDMVENSLISAYPELFTFTENAIPIDVTIKISETEQKQEIGWYLLSLSILPGKITQTDDIKVLVHIDDSEHTGHVKLNSHVRITVISPFAWSGNIEPEVGYNGAHEAQSTFFETMGNPRIVDIRKRIFLIELTEEINSIVRRMEQQE